MVKTCPAMMLLGKSTVGPAFAVSPLKSLVDANPTLLRTNVAGTIRVVQGDAVVARYNTIFTCAFFL